ncbi:MAG: FecR domain-containing protein, partial [Chloroflexi bacterium]|nr:FecR domain-containing protein [Chloroflexota bacterium]
MARRERFQTRRWITLLVLLIMILASYGGQARQAAAQDDPVASLLVTLESATITTVDGESTEYPLDEVAVVGVGDEIAVSANGEAILTFFEGVETRLAAGTTVKVTEFETTDTASQIGLSVVVGQTMSSVEQMSDAESRFEISTPVATISVRGTFFLVFVRPTELTQVVTLDGIVAVNSEGLEAEVPPGYGVRVDADKTLGGVNPWGLAMLSITAPAGDVDDLPVLMQNQANGQLFHYRASDVLAAPLGRFDVIVQSPGPYKTEVVFGEDYMAEDVIELTADLSTVMIELVDEAGNMIADAGNLIVHLKQGDLEGETVVAPGDPIIVGPGEWEVEIALESDPENILSVNLTMGEGEALTAQVDVSEFEA